MSFLTDKEELKPGLIIFRRGDVDHRNWYCRIKLPKVDRYKTVSLKTSDIGAARERAFDQDADIRFRLKHDVPVFNRPFSQVGQEYIELQKKRAAVGEITQERVKRVKSVIEGRLAEYVGTTQIHLIGHDRWENYPSWRRAAGEGRMARPGHTRALTEDELAANKAKADADALAKTRLFKRRRAKGKAADAGEEAKPVKKHWVFVSDATISFEMSIFDAVMSYAASKRYIPASNRFEGRPALKRMRRDEFTPDEYRSLHSKGRAWVKKAKGAAREFYREVTYNFILIMCNTGMRPSEAKNLRWRDITIAKDRDKQDLMVLFVRGKGKQRKLVAPKSVGEYLERIRKLSKATGPDDAVFTTHTGEPTKSLYKHLVEDLLNEAGLHEGPSGIPRSTYCFRHTYATFRLSEGVDVYFLAEQMGTSVQMIQEHYGHVNTIKHADRVLQGMMSWDPVEATDEAAATDEVAEKDGKAAHATAIRLGVKEPVKITRSTRRSAPS